MPRNHNLNGLDEGFNDGAWIKKDKKAPWQIESFLED